MKRLVYAIILARVACAQPQSISLAAGPPSPIIIVSAQAVAPFGANPFCYWVVVNYPIGHSTPSAPSCISNANPVSTVGINWNTVPGATSYDVLRTATPILPGGASNIAVGTLVSGPPLVDSFSALSSYTVNTAGTANALFLLDNQNQTNPSVRLTIGNTAGFSSSFLLGASGGSFYQTLGIVGTSQTQRARLNLIAGANISISNSDNSGTGSSDVTIVATAGGGATKLNGTATFSYGSAIQDGDCLQGGTTITVTGAVVGDPVYMGTNAVLAQGVDVFGKVTSSNTVTVEVCNLSGAAVTPASTTYSATVIH